MPQVTLEAPQISCYHCIQEAVTKLSGVTFVLADPVAKQVTLDCDSGAVSIGRIEGVMEEEGHSVKK